MRALEINIDDETQELCIRNNKLQAEVQRLRQWVNDLQSGMYVNCVYCGHRYGPESEVPATMADVLKEHIERCPKHPMSKLEAENERLREAMHEIGDYALEYQDLNTDMKEIAKMTKQALKDSPCAS